MKSLTRPLLVVPLALVLAIGAGVAFGQVVDPDEPSVAILAPEDCDDATTAFEAAGIPAPGYQGECPTPERVDELIDYVEEDQKLRAELEEEGFFTAEEPEASE